MTAFFAQQCDLSPLGIHSSGVLLKENTLDDIKAAVKKNPTHIHPWLIFKSTDEGTKIFPVMYVNINEGKWLDL